MSAPEFPKITPPQVAVLLAESEAGTILRPNGNVSLGGSCPFLIFDTLESAEEFARHSNHSSKIEFNAYFADGSYIGLLARS